MQDDQLYNLEAAAVTIQVFLEDYPSDDADDEYDREQCWAYADSTGERCQHPSMPKFPYCHDHRHLLDEVDATRYVLRTGKSAGRDERDNPNSGGGSSL